ncbi:MAG: hypothetical protein ACRETR_04015, partial [Steroidobacteraceae bacterium]
MRTGLLCPLYAGAAQRASSARLAAALFAASILVHTPAAIAGAGPLGIDTRVSYDNSGIWARSNQNAVIDSMMAVVGVGALWEG